MLPPPQHRLPETLVETLAAVAGRLVGVADPWWIIGSTAAALHGLTVAAIGDVDVVTSVADARRLSSGPNAIPVADGGSGTFRSDIFVRLTGLPMKVEILGGFSVRGTRLAIATRVAMPVREALVFVPSREELVGIFRLFGRPKDLARAEALAALG